MSDWLIVSFSYSLTGKSNKLFLFSLRNAVGTATMAKLPKAVLLQNSVAQGA